MGSEKYTGLINLRKHHFNGMVRTHNNALAQPLRRKKDTLWFVNSMSDLFHEAVPFQFIAAVFGVMGTTSQHQYQVLTKRPARMQAFFDWMEIMSQEPAAYCMEAASLAMGELVKADQSTCWPLPNVWLGTSVEDNRAADRITTLQSVPAQVRFLSCEPLIGSVDLVDRLDGIHWVIVGGESGAGARPMEAEWAEQIQDACHRAGVAFFFKQTGSSLAREWGLTSKKGSDADEWPKSIQDLGQRAFPRSVVA